MFRLSSLLMLVLLTGCASLPEGTQRSDDDPWERYNRAMYQFNDAVDSSVLRPLAVGYDTITPDPVQTGVANFFDNLSYPVTILNQFLQGKIGDGLAGIGRFLINTTVGFAGIFDPATKMGIDARDEDFGQTLGVWGVPRGPYLVLPFLGPSSVRGTIGFAGDVQVDPVWRNVDLHEDARYGLLFIDIVQTRAQYLDLDSQISEAYDPYTFLRDAYLQRREFQLYDGNPPQDQYDELYDDLYDFDDFDEEGFDEPVEDEPAAAVQPEESIPAGESGDNTSRE
ncbi:MAG: VacJ family lipoprotein [Gammaproteobacteria bacterium]|nr:VacJ family lipoprotein [Gammaproteobacteria bacterium]